MTKKIPMTKNKENTGAREAISDLGMSRSFFIGHSTFVIFHSGNSKQHGDKKL
jgi:hypothetical protein